MASFLFTAVIAGLTRNLKVLTRFRIKCGMTDKSRAELQVNEVANNKKLSDKFCKPQLKRDK